ncbi:MAG: hypothetical protein HY698_05450, partial [Deltaproteobacteria bacterium]|nr:hypothetical protein [Deltaproteobacteria bacterium]
AESYTCKKGGSPYKTIYETFKAQRAKIWGSMSPSARAALEPFSPNGCFQGPIGKFKLDKNQSLTTVGGASIVLEAGEHGIKTDFNGDNKPDLINECMMWNCLLSPGTKNCPLRAIIQELPTSKLAGNLVCEDVNIVEVLKNPDLMLSATAVDIPRPFYKKLFLERRFPLGAEPGTLGTYSLGGFVPNGVYAATDLLRVMTAALDGLREPVRYIAEKCTGLGGAPSLMECQLAAKVAAIRSAMDMGIALLVGLGAAAQVIPFVGTALGAAFFAAAAVLTAGVVLLDQAIIPGLTLPLQAMREKLLLLLEEKWVDTIMNSAHAMSGKTCINTCGGGPTDCAEHRFLGLQAYFDWAIDAYQIVSSFRCEENSYVTRLLEGGLRTRDWFDLIKSGFTLFLTQYLGCKVLDYFYTNFLREKLREALQASLVEQAGSAICKVGAFYLTEAEKVAGLKLMPDGSSWERSCKEAIKTLYGDPEDPITIIKNLRELIAALDRGGITPAQKAKLFPVLEKALLVTTGVRVNLFALDKMKEAVDCSFVVDPKLKISARDVVIEAFRLVLGEKAAAFVSDVDRDLGYYKELLAKGFDDLNPIPIDVKKFYPLYNTIQLNKLILLGSGESACERARRKCQGGELFACAEGYLSSMIGRNCAPAGGLFELIRKANAVTLPPAYQAAYSTALLDEAPSSYRDSFFQEAWIADPASAVCSEVDWNIMCNALYSLDDPDDYCRELAAWDLGYFVSVDKDKAGVTNGVIPECGPALKGIDDSASAYYSGQYLPNGRRISAPGGDPRDQYKTPLYSEAHANAYNHRSTVVDRVVGQSAWGDALPRSGSDSTILYYPHDLSRFSLTNQDSHVARLYSRIFAPYYCPDVGYFGTADAGQADQDCDTVPDECDKCPETYNPDQLDQDLNGIGDDCPGYNPFTGKTPVEQIRKLCSHEELPKGNLIKNGGFEAAPYDLIDWARTLGGSAYSRGPDGKQRSGRRAMYLQANPGSWLAGVQSVSVSPNRRYRLTGYVLAPGIGTGRFRVQKMGSTTTLAEKTFGSSSKYQKVELEFSSGDATGVYVQLGYTGSAGSWVRIDDVSLVFTAFELVPRPVRPPFRRF